MAAWLTAHCQTRERHSRASLNRSLATDVSIDQRMGKLSLYQCRSSCGAWQEYYINGLVQERRNSNVLAMKLRLSCTNPSIRNGYFPGWSFWLSRYWSDIATMLTDERTKDISLIYDHVLQRYFFMNLMINAIIYMYIYIYIHIYIWITQRTQHPKTWTENRAFLFCFVVVC